MTAARITIALVASLFATTLAQAQEWPTRPITLVVPFAAGGTADLVARPIAQGLTEKLGQSVVVENKAGAGGTLAFTKHYRMTSRRILSQLRLLRRCRTS